MVSYLAKPSSLVLNALCLTLDAVGQTIVALLLLRKFLDGIFSFLETRERQIAGLIPTLSLTFLITKVMKLLLVFVNNLSVTWPLWEFFDSLCPLLFLHRDPSSVHCISVLSLLHRLISSGIETASLTNSFVGIVCGSTVSLGRYSHALLWL